MKLFANAFVSCCSFFPDWGTHIHSLIDSRLQGSEGWNIAWLFFFWLREPCTQFNWIGKTSSNSIAPLTLLNFREKWLLILNTIEVKREVWWCFFLKVSDWRYFVGHPVQGLSLIGLKWKVDVSYVIDASAHTSFQITIPLEEWNSLSRVLIWTRIYSPRRWNVARPVSPPPPPKQVVWNY